ncbi:ssDNA binding protein [Pantoea phage Phynn]|nr:ssDNA binding protein [Pantoea phage Phynn]
MSIFKRQDPTKLQQQVAQLKGSSGFQKDEKEWKPTLDAQKNGSAVIRFLPARSDDELAFVRLVSHSFKNNGNWFIENCPSTHGDYDGCPLCVKIKEEDLFEKAKVKGSPAEKLLGQISRKNSFWANVLVIKDPGSPENEGKVFKYRFGKKIMDKITAAIAGNPELDEEGIAVTCPFGGANFSLKIKQVGGYTNYDDCQFGQVSQIKGIEDESRQKEIFEGMSDLRPIIAPSEFKSKEELDKRYFKVMGVAAGSAGGASASASLDDELSGFDKELQNFDNGSSQSAGATGSGGIGQVPTGAGDSLSEDDTPPFNTGSSSNTDDDDLNALLDDI